MTVHALLVTGAPGVGKSVVANEIGELLRLADAPSAVIDLDALGRVHPPAGGTYNSDLIIANLAATWPHYAALGVRYVVLARVIGNHSEHAAIEDALGGAAVTVCRLVAPQSVISDRLTRRETGLALPFLQRISPIVGAEIDLLAVEDFSVENGAGRTVTAVAGEIVAHMEWPG